MSIPTQLPSNPSDLALVRQSLAGRRRAVDDLVERMRCVPRMLSAKNRDMGRPLSDTEMEDLVQETLVAIWRKLPGYNGRARIETWAYSFCLFEILRCLRARDRQPGRLEESEFAELHGRASREEASIFDHERVHSSLEGLDPIDASVVRLKHFEDCTFREVGQRLDLPTNTAKTRYYRALNKLRGRLAESVEVREGVR